MIVYLIGFMGSGKSTLGKRIASRMGWQFNDLDALIEESEGRSVLEIFDKSGEEYFRRIESGILRDIAEQEDMVLACGGGTPCYNDNMDYMNESGLTIYIKHEPGTIYHRLKNARKERPLVKGMNEDELKEYIKNLLVKREKWYKQSKVIIDGLSADPERIAEIITFQPPGIHD